jgi:hypothetical protein
MAKDNHFAGLQNQLSLGTEEIYAFPELRFREAEKQHGKDPIGAWGE